VDVSSKDAKNLTFCFMQENMSGSNATCLHICFHLQ